MISWWGGKKKHILIVDDEPEVCRVINSFFAKKGFKISQAHNGKDALSLIGKAPPNLIILDVAMPVMDGFELLQYLKTDAKYSQIPVIMLTIKSDRRHVERGISLQADFYLSKPFNLDNLKGFVNLILK